MNAPRVLVGGGAVDPARLYRRLLGQLAPAPTATLVMPGSSDTDPRPLDRAHNAPHPVAGSVDLHTEKRAVASSIAGLHVGRTPVDLVGFSGGAVSALAYAMAHPHDVRRLVLIEPSWLGNHPPSAADAAYLRELDAVMALPDEQLGPAFTRHFSPHRPPDAETAIPPQRLTRAATGMRDVWQRWRQVRAQPDLTRFPGPLLIVAGGRSHPRMAGMARDTAALTPRGRSLISDAHDHFTVTAGTTPQVAEFIDGPDPGDIHQGPPRPTT